MTEYEQHVAEGGPPMKGLEWIFLESACEDALKGNISIEDKETMELMMMEIEHLYRDHQEKINKIKEIVAKL
jgi:hypothetical protein